MHNNQHKHHLLLICVLEFQLQISFFSRIQISFIKKKKKKKIVLFLFTNKLHSNKHSLRLQK